MLLKIFVIFIKNNFIKMYQLISKLLFYIHMHHKLYI